MNTYTSESGARDLLGQLIRQDLTRLDLDADLALELGLDSLAKLRLLAGVEKRLGVRFSDAELSRLRTLRQILAAMPGRSRQGCDPAVPASFAAHPSPDSTFPATDSQTINDKQP